MDKNHAIRIAKEYSQLVRKHLLIEKAYLFGSYANNRQHEDSDIDVAFVVNKLDGDNFSINPLLWKLSRQIDERIEPIIIERDKDPSNFLSDIAKNGIEIM